MINIFDLAMREAEEVAQTDPESLCAGADAFDRLVAGTFYDNIPASYMLDPNTHPYGPDYVPGMPKVRV